MPLFSSSLCQIQGDAVKDAVDVVDHVDHTAHGDGAFADAGHGVDLAVKQVAGQLDALELHDGAILLGVLLDGDHVVVAHADTGGGTVLDGHLDHAVGDQMGAEAADLIPVADLGQGDGDQVEHQLGAGLKEGLILQILGIGTEILGQQVRQGHKALEKETDVQQALGGDGGHGAVDHAVELFAGRKRDADGGLGIAPVLKPAVAVLEVQRGGGAVLHVKADGEGLLVLQQGSGVLIQLAEVFESTEDRIHVDVRKGF